MSKLPVKIVTKGGVPGRLFKRTGVIPWVKGVHSHPIPMTQAQYDIASGVDLTFLLEDGTGSLLLESGDYLLKEA